MTTTDWSALEAAMAKDLHAYNRNIRPEDYRAVVPVDSSRIVDRDPCFCCGTKRSIGCAHTRIAA